MPSCSMWVKSAVSLYCHLIITNHLYGHMESYITILQGFVESSCDLLLTSCIYMSIPGCMHARNMFVLDGSAERYFLQLVPFNKADQSLLKYRISDIRLLVIIISNPNISSRPWCSCNRFGCQLSTCHLIFSQVSGIDSVDDESKPESVIFDKDSPTPEKWNSTENPPYSYYAWYMYANIAVLNHFRRLVMHGSDILFTLIKLELIMNWPSQSRSGLNCYWLHWSYLPFYMSSVTQLFHVDQLDRSAGYIVILV